MGLQGKGQGRGGGDWEQGTVRRSDRGLESVPANISQLHLPLHNHQQYSMCL